MISTILLSVLPLAVPTSPTLPPTVPIVDEEIEQKIAACGEDVAKLLALAESYNEADDSGSARTVYARVLEVDSANEVAHKALRHHFYDDQWFESYAQLSKYRREEAKRMKEEHGLVRFNDEWVAETDLPYLRMGWTKNDDGTWVSQHKLDRAKALAELQEAGYTRQYDLTWISPEEAEANAGMWKCGEEFLDTEGADAYHAQLGTWWEAPSEQGHFIVYSTLGIEHVAWVGWYADKTHPDLVRVFGVQPAEPPVFVCLKTIDQYNEFAAGSQANQLPPTEIDGFSSLHYAFFAESFFDITVNPPEYNGAGVAYWDRSDPNLDPYGQHSIRHAAAQSYCEAIDPSWNAVSQIVANPGGGGGSTEAFWAEKQIPRWMRYGAASYVERYFHDEGDNPWWARDWALANLQAADGVNDLDTIFAFGLDLNDIPGSTQLIHESGAVVSFMMDGECAPVVEAHGAFKQALQKGEGAKEEAVALQEAIKANEAAFMAYAGLSALGHAGEEKAAEHEGAEQEVGEGEGGEHEGGDGAG